MNDEPENISSSGEGAEGVTVEKTAPPPPDLEATVAPTEPPPVAEKKPDPIRHNSKRNGN